MTYGLISGLLPPLGLILQLGHLHMAEKMPSLAPGCTIPFYPTLHREGFLHPAPECHSQGEILVGLAGEACKWPSPGELPPGFQSRGKLCLWVHWGVGASQGKWGFVSEGMGNHALRQNQPLPLSSVRREIFKYNLTGNKVSKSFSP